MYSGIDVVDIERFSDRIEANAALMQRLFSADELNSCKGALPSLAVNGQNPPPGNAPYRRL